MNPDPEMLPSSAVRHYDPPLPAPDDRTPAERLARYAQVDAQALADSSAASTRIAYRRWWDRFEDWCLEYRFPPCPASPETVRAFVAYLRDDRNLLTPSIGQALSAIWARHSEEGRDSPARTDPALRKRLQGYSRQDRERETHQMKALMTADARRIITTMDATLATALAATEDERVQRKHQLIDLRDRAVILFGTASAHRRDELVRLSVSDVAAVEEGLQVTARWSKADQAGTRRRARAIPRGNDLATCPVIAYQKWLVAADITSGPIFRSVSMWGKVGATMSAQSIRLIVKERAEAAQLPGTWGAHSLRAGFATQASKNKASVMAVKEHGGWSSDAVFAYFRDTEIWEDPAAGYLGY